MYGGSEAGLDNSPGNKIMGNKEVHYLSTNVIIESCHAIAMLIMIITPANYHTRAFDVIDDRKVSHQCICKTQKTTTKHSKCSVVGYSTTPYYSHCVA